MQLRSSEIKTNKQKVFFQLAQGSCCKLRREIPMKMWMVVKPKQINEVGMGKKANRNIIAYVENPFQISTPRGERGS